MKQLTNTSLGNCEAKDKVENKTTNVQLKI